MHAKNKSLYYIFQINILGTTQNFIIATFSSFLQGNAHEANPSSNLVRFCFKFRRSRLNQSIAFSEKDLSNSSKPPRLSHACFPTNLAIGIQSRVAPSQLFSSQLI